MGTRDIRSGEDWVDNATIREDTEWAEKVEATDEEIAPKTSYRPTAIPMTTAGGQQLLNAQGKPAGMKSMISHTKDEIAQLWDLKKTREPCFLCRFYQPRQVSADEKILLWRNLMREHGYTDDMVRGEFGDPRNFEYCALHRILTHKHASCPRGWKPRF